MSQHREDVLRFVGMSHSRKAERVLAAATLQENPNKISQCQTAFQAANWQSEKDLDRIYTEALN